MTSLSQKVNFWFCITHGGYAIMEGGWMLLKGCYLTITSNEPFNGMVFILPLILMAFGLVIVKIGLDQWPHAPILTFGKKFRNNRQA